MEKIQQISLVEINPHIRRSAVNCLAPGFSTGCRRIYHYQIQYIYSGCGEVEIEGITYSASKGNLFFWGPGEIHTIKSSVNDPLTILGVQFDFSRNHEDKKYLCDLPQNKSFRHDDINEIIIFKDFAGFHPCIKVQSPAKAEQLLLEIAKEFKTQKIFYQERIRSLFKAFLLMIARQAVTNDNSLDNELLIDRVMEFIHENFGRNLTNKDIASHFNFHPNYLNKLMVKNTGMSLHQYILNTRISKALDLLNTTDMTVGEIAIEVGFDNIYHFSRIFKAKLGYPPSHRTHPF